MVVESVVQIMRSGHHGSHAEVAGGRGRMKRRIKVEQAEEGRWGEGGREKVAPFGLLWRDLSPVTIAVCFSPDKRVGTQIEPLPVYR